MRSVRKTSASIGERQEKGDACLADYLQKGGVLGEGHNVKGRGGRMS